MDQQQDREKKALFSVILLHYNQQKFLHTSLGSIFEQDYPNIELIFADDASSALDVQGLDTYIRKNKGENIKNVIIQVNQDNQGTVKTVNQAVKAARGEYVLFFAADDSLYDRQTLSHYAAAFSELPSDQYIVSSQCHMMDESLSELLSPFVNEPLAYSLNMSSAEEQYKKLATSCLYAIGSTAFRSEIWKKFGYFDEQYKIIEDWSFFLHMTRNGVKIMYYDFIGLKHRDGGVSHFNQSGIPPHVIEYRNDSLTIQEKEILPYLSIFSRGEQISLIERYEAERKAFEAVGTGKQRVRRIDIIKSNKGFFFRKGIWWMMGTAPVYRHVFASRLPKFLSCWVLLMILQIIAPLSNSLALYQFVHSLPYQIVNYGSLVLFGLNLVCYLVMGGLSFLFFTRKERNKYFMTDK